MAEKTTTTAIYISKYLKLRIPIKAAYYQEVNGKRVVVPGNSVRFEDGMFSTTDEGLMKELESRPDFGSVFIRVADQHEAAKAKNNLKAPTDKERELAQREADLNRREALIKAKEEGAGADSEGSQDGGPRKVSTKMTVAELVEIATAEGVQVDPDTQTKAEIVEAIGAAREKTNGTTAPKY